MATFPSRQFYISQVIGTGTSADPWRPAIWGECAGDKACIHIVGRGAWVVGTTPTASCMVRAMVTSAEQLTITADAKNLWLACGEDIITTSLDATTVSTINTAAPTYLPSWVPLVAPITVIDLVENVAAQFDSRTPLGLTWWGY